MQRHILSLGKLILTAYCKTTKEQFIFLANPRFSFKDQRVVSCWNNPELVESTAARNDIQAEQMEELTLSRLIEEAASSSTDTELEVKC